MIPVPITDNGIGTLPASTVETARELDVFFAENAKSARAFLKSVAHPKPIAELSISEIGHRPDPAKIRDYLAPLLAGKDAGVVSEAGCPGIADPGAQLAAAAQAAGIRVVPLVGPCSMILALMASGLDGQHFRFSGYVPIKEPQRSAAIRDLEQRSRSGEGETQLFIETPYRNSAMLKELCDTLRPDTRILVATDVTGAEESIRTKTAAEWKKTDMALPKLPTVFGLLAAPGFKKSRR